MNRSLFAKHAEDRAPSGCSPQARWLVARSSRTAPGTHRRSRLAWGPAAECELISARILRMGLLLAQGQVEVKDPVLIFGAAGLLRRNE
jgi:hypothetical protein